METNRLTYNENFLPKKLIIDVSTRHIVFYAWTRDFDV